MLNFLRKYTKMPHQPPAAAASTALPAALEARRPRSQPETDYSSLSSYRDFQVKHSSLDLRIEFAHRQIAGTVRYELHRLNAHAREIVLDSSFVQVNSVTLNDTAASFQLRDRTEPLGSALVVQVGEQLHAHSSLSLLIDFATTEQCTAIQWLKTDLGSPGDRVDYVFTQLEPIHARSLFPCFDTPSVKSPFSATIASERPVVFSGLPVEPQAAPGVYRFEQKVPIPSYLVALASGNIVSKRAGPRSRIYAEPGVVDDAISEFQHDLESFIQIAEDLATPYIWTTYDVLINPPSFPYGGMENPNITFVTPTLIAHDRSQVDVIAHELAHSWSGNNVTNCSWEHFWLNEGWTVYLERRITGRIHGEKTRQFQFLLGWNDLVEAIDSLETAEYSKLVQDLHRGRIDPDDTFSSVPYEKGSNFIYHLETQLGLASFDQFIKFYFAKFSRQSIDTYQFVDSLYEFYARDEKKLAVLNRIDWELWLFKTGLPPKADFDGELIENVEKLVALWKSKTFGSAAEYTAFFSSKHVKHDLYDQFSSLQKVYFIDQMNKETATIANDKVSSSMLAVYSDLNESRNSEIIFRWFKFKLLSNHTEFYHSLADWLGTVGRMKYVRPSYRLLYEKDPQLAVDTFNRFKDRYHPIAVNLVKKDLHL